ncbi:MAG: hypothetical protein GY927_04685 [bacterium]|nr:hypothetical protein [bacterium]
MVLNAGLQCRITKAFENGKSPLLRDITALFSSTPAIDKPLAGFYAGQGLDRFPDEVLF